MAAASSLSCAVWKGLSERFLTKVTLFGLLFQTGVILTNGTLSRLLTGHGDFHSSHRFRVYQDGAEAIWVKTISRRRDKAILSCLPGHVIYRPYFLIGARADPEVSQSTRRSISWRDCRGLAINTATQVYKCYWQRSCRLSWRERLPIVASVNASCVGRMPDYVIFNNPLCIPLPKVITMCDTGDIIDAEFGVLRSHRSYPWDNGKRNTSVTCRKILLAKVNHTLAIHIEDLNISVQDRLIVYYIASTGSQMLPVGGENQHAMTFSVTSGRIVIDYIMGVSMTAAEAAASGFVIRFEQKLFNYQETGLTTGVVAERISSFGLSHFRVRASISRCLTSKEEAITLACPENHVIFQPELRHGVSGWEKRCQSEAGDCSGLTHTLVVQQNQCHWRPECSLSWQDRVPILLADDLRCLAKSPDYVELTGAQCLPEDSVYDICDRSFWSMTTTNGFLRSHPDYPWEYGDSPRVCRKRIFVHRKFGLRVAADKLGLSPYSDGDRLKVWHVKEDNSRILVGVYRHNHSLDHLFTSGCVDIEFKKTKRQNRGHGFVLRLESVIPVTDNNSEFWQCGSLLESVKNHQQLMARKRLRRIASMMEVDATKEAKKIKKGRNGGGGKPKKVKLSCSVENNEMYEVTAQQMAKRIKLDCSKGSIANVDLVGHNGTCRGLTPDLFVQMNSCFWKNKCELAYDVSAPNYMVKLFSEDNITKCITKQPSNFTLTYSCTKRKPPLFLQVGGSNNIANAKEAVVVSHLGHPWHYKRDEHKAILTVQKAKNKGTHFFFTIRSLSLVSNDKLIVTWAKGDQEQEWKTFDFNDSIKLSDPLTNRTHAIEGASKVTFTLDKTIYTNGGEGFVLCYQWMEWKDQMGKDKGYDACRNLISLKACKGRKGATKRTQPTLTN